MTNLICNKCQNAQKENLIKININKLKCNRCGSKDLDYYHRKVKLYYLCQNCNKYFKISDTVSKELINLHSNPECPYCTSNNTKPTLKRKYKIFSGQQQKKHNTKLIELEIVYESK